MKRRSVLIASLLLLLITLVAWGLRLYHLDAHSLWYDEGFSVYLARMSPAEITARTAADIQPPLYYYLLHGWIGSFGDGERALRSLSLLFGVLTVPLIYAVAWQLFRNRLAGLLAALLVAVSPLHVWYGQEARMYTLLTFLCLLSSYLLLLAIQAEKRWQTLALWPAYTLANIAALYTHYFALFVLVFQALYVLLVWVGGGFRPARLVLGGIFSGLVTLGAYLPWLPYLFIRYGTDVSYWPGQLKISEILLDIALSFTGGESVLESIGTYLAIGYGVAFVLCLFAFLVYGSQIAAHGSRTARFPLAFLLLYLLIPPALILLLSYNAPKFNARYMMVSHPAFLLVLGGGLAALWQRRPSNAGTLFSRVLAAVALAFMLGVSMYANNNAYSDPVFARADFRAASRYIEKHIAPDETIILSSGHMFPVFDYYAPAMERHLLPDNPTLDTTRTLDYAIANDLKDWLADRGGVWLVLWQHEVVDPAGYLTTMLAETGEELAVDRTFAKVGVKHYRLPEGSLFSDQPPIAHPTDFNFGNRLQLLGYTQTGERQVTLFWRALEPLEEDYRVSLTLRDTAGQRWGQWDGRPTAYFYPTDRWRVGQTVFGRSDLPLIPGAPPGDYGLEVGVYTEADPIGLDVLDKAGAPQGKRAVLGAVRLSAPAVTPDQVEIPHPGRIDLGGGLALQGWDLEQDEAQPGDRLVLTLVWSVESQPQGEAFVQLFVTDAEGRRLDAGTFPPTNVWHPTSMWQAGQAWRGQMTFRLPIQAGPGDAVLGLRLSDAGGTALGPLADLTTIQVLAADRVFTPPQPQVRRTANFGGKVALHGADLAPNPVAPGDVLRVTLYWQALAEMDVPYTVFVHLLGADGQVIAGHDGEPVSAGRPTTGWVPGEFVADSHEVHIPADLAAGEYVIEVGLYDAGVPGLPRLAVLDDQGQSEADLVIFGPVQVR